VSASVWEVIGPNFLLLLVSLLAFAAVIYAVFLLGARSSIKAQEWVRYLVFLGPASLLLLIGLIYPAIRTVILSFMDKKSDNFVGFDN